MSNDQARENGQQQEMILLKFKDGSICSAVRTGNNAAWFCACDYQLPLVWGGNTPNRPTVCTECGKSYIGRGADKLQGKPREISEFNASKADREAQPQVSIPMEIDGEEKYTAIKVGSGGGANAAWRCVCGYKLPLIWSEFPPQEVKRPTVCGKCGRKFKGEGRLDKIMGAA